ncbi:alpha-2-HS-glycoprotein [Manis javanica]|uniref:alpha-2-HS-glycoprotein n=1 Tax=Manis javanica TaxID=9974 RepID=UPI000813B898|nr:alpha-2-HS-glycoprotein [Manis javanica]KAI5940256.1 Alpha-2-HS-glycoprotein [Manis javanica]
MKSLVLLLCLAQLWGCHSAPHNPGLGYRQPNCDDPEVEEAALAAVEYINKHRLQGYKHTLNQIDKVKVWTRRPTGEVYELEIDLLETTCHVLDPTPVANCTVRQLQEHAVEGDCDFRILKLDNQFSILSAKCDSSPDSAEDVHKVCPDCPLLAPRNNTRVVHAVEVALATFNAQNNGSYFQLVEVSRAKISLLPPSILVEFVVAATDCAAAEVVDSAKCNLLADKVYGFCKATVTEKVGGEDVVVTCTVFPKELVVLQPQPDGADAEATTSVVGAAVPASLAAVQLVGFLLARDVPVAPPVHQAHYDLHNSFAGVASVESASGEAFHVEKISKEAQPGIILGPGPVVRPCPGRIRHFKV